MRGGEVQRLSGSVTDGGATAITTYPTKVTVHTVPAGETHEVWLSVSNTNGSTAVEILGDMGGDADTLDESVATETVEQLLRGEVLVGPTTVKISAVANASNVHFFGKVRVYPYTS